MTTVHPPRRQPVFILLAILLVTSACGGSTPSGGSSNPTAPTPAPTPAPPESAPTPSPPTRDPATFNGTYGPATFRKLFAQCPERFLPASFTATILISNNATSVSLVESVRRDSTCTFTPNALLARCSGSGTIPGGEPATWTLDVQFLNSVGSSFRAVENVRLPAWSNCTEVYESATMIRQ